QEGIARVNVIQKESSVQGRPVAERRRTYPVSFSQQQLWVLDRLDPGNPSYNIPYAMSARGPLSVAALRESLNLVVNRHESLRTTFAEVAEEPVQVVGVRWSVPLPIIDLGDVPESERESEAMRRARDEARRPFDLTQGPLMRAAVLRLSAHE